MNRNKKMILGCIGLSMALITGSALCFPTPSTARVINNDVLSIQLEPIEVSVPIRSDLLTEEGQIILVNDDFTEMVVPITVSCDDLEQTEGSAITGSIQAVSSDETRMTAALDAQEITLTEEACTVNLTMTKIAATEPETGDAEISEPETGDAETAESEENVETEGEMTPKTEIEEDSEEEVETTPETAVEESSGTKDGSETEGKITPETGAEESSGTEDGSEEEVETTLETGTEESSEVESQAAENDAASQSETEQESETTELTSGTENQGEESSETDIETPQGTEGGNETEEIAGTEGEITSETEDETGNEETSESVPEETELSAEITLTIGEQVFSATIVVVENDKAKEVETALAEAEQTDETGEETAAAEELQFCQSQYYPTEAITLIGGADAEYSIGEFPAMTKYTLEEKTYLLYNGGNIALPAGKEVKINLSLTGLAEDLILTTSTGKTYTVKYVELPELPEEVSPLIMNEEGISFKMTKTWGTIEPTITIEHLTVVEKETIWETVETVKTALDAEGKITFTPDAAAAGTYRAIVSWIENEITLYQMEIPFFIQYKSVGQGGTGQ